MKLFYPVIVSIICFSNSLISQPRTVGVVKYSADNKSGYCLFSPVGTKTTFLMDKCGRKIKEWTSNYPPGMSLTLTPEGKLIRAGAVSGTNFGGGVGGVLERYDWDGNLEWQYIVADSEMVFHHDFKVMKNGNILAILWEVHSIADAVANGRDPDKTNYTVWSERIQELRPVGADSAEVVWEWRAWDHMIQDFDSSKSNFGNVSGHRELFDINFTNNNKLNDGQDWFHFNSLDYNEDLDQIMLSAHSLDEIYIIDHSTTTTEASGHSGGLRNMGGDVLFRWGNSLSYRSGDSTNWRVFHGHHATWIPKGMQHEGQIMFFNNGLNRPGAKYTTIDRISPPVNGSGSYMHLSGMPFSPLSASIVYKSQIPTNFYSSIMGGVYPIDDDHIFTTLSTSGTVYEIKGDSVVWKYVNPFTLSGSVKQGNNPGMNYVFRYEFYPEDYAAFDGKDMSPGMEIEAQPYTSRLCDKPPLPLYSIQKIRAHNKTTGMADSLNIHCRISGTIQSANLSETGCMYFIGDGTGNILISDTLNDRRWNPGDSVVVTGRVGQRSGWTLFTNIDSIVGIVSGKQTKKSVNIARPDELHESVLVKLKRVRILSMASWPGTPLLAGKIARLAIENTDGVVDSVFIYSATDIDGTALPKGYLDISGFVGQWDNTKPHLSNYFLMPRGLFDIENSTLPAINFIKNSDSSVFGNAKYQVTMSNLPAEENYSVLLVAKGGNAVNGQDYFFANKTVTITRSIGTLITDIDIDATPDFIGTRTAQFVFRDPKGPGVLGKDSLFTLYIKGGTLNHTRTTSASGISVFPVPAKDVVHITSEKDMQHIGVLDISGKMLVMHPVSGKTANLPLLQAPGLYTLVVVCSNGSVQHLRIEIGE